MPVRRPQAAALAAITAAIIASVVAVPIILFAPLGGRQAFDQNLFHLKAIERFSRQWPAPDLRDYESATTPGYHLALALVHRFVTDNTTALRLVSLVFTLALVAGLAWSLAARAPPIGAVALTLPLVCSLYVLSSATALLPDNLAWLLVMGVLLLALRPRVDGPALALAGLALLALVLTRQVHLWAAAPIWLAAWLADRPPTLWPARHERATTFARTALAVACTLPAFLAVFLFARLWGGLTPPAFQPAGSPLTTPDYTAVQGRNPANPALILAIVAVLAPFFVGFFAHTLRSIRPWPIALLAAILGTALAIVPDTTYSLEHGRYSGLWALAKLGPVLLNHTAVALVPLSAAGAALLALFFQALPRREALILAGALAAFTAAQTMNALAWQRYIEPLVLLMLALAAGTMLQRTPAPPRWAYLGPALLAGLLAIVTWLSWR
jgi:hypothetical protein